MNTKCYSLSIKREDSLWGAERKDMHVEFRKPFSREQ